MRRALLTPTILAVAFTGPALASDDQQPRPSALVKPDGSQWVMEGCAAYQAGQTATGTGHLTQVARSTAAMDKLRASFPPRKSPKQSRPATE